jgi:flavodoxin
MKVSRRAFTISMLAFAAATGAGALLGGTTAFAAQPNTGKTLVIFFSWGGNTRAIAKQIHQKVGGDLIELELIKPYSTNYNTCLDEAKRDQEREVRPELKTRIPDMNQYDVVYLGYPNWWATIPMPIATLLETYDFTGKTIAPFCSHGGGRLGQSITDIVKLAPGAAIKEGLSIHYSGGSSLRNDISAWLRKIGIEEK